MDDERDTCQLARPVSSVLFVAYLEFRVRFTKICRVFENVAQGRFWAGQQIQATANARLTEPNLK